MTLAALDQCAGQMDPGLPLCKYFGSLWKSFSSIYKGMIGAISWNTLTEALQDIHIAYGSVFVMFITVTTGAFVHVFTGIYLNDVRILAESESSDTYFHDELKKKEVFMRKMRAIFNHADLDSSGALTRAELRHAFKDNDCAAMLASMKLDSAAAEKMFDLLDHDSSGLLTISEWVLGCLRLQGQAQSLDLQILQKETESMSDSVADVKKQMHTISAMLGKLGGGGHSTAMEDDRERDFVSEPSRFSKGSAIPRVARLSSDRNSQLKEEIKEVKRVSFQAKENAAKRSEKRPRTDRMVRSCTGAFISSITKNVSGKRIPKTELRAMCLHELEGVLSLIRSACVAESWTDTISGEYLTPEQVNLYQFNYNAICPLTVSGSITLTGLMESDYSAEQILKQYDTTGRLTALGVILVGVYGTDVKIRLIRGNFSESSIILTEDGELCGRPKRVLCSESISYKELISATPTPPTWYTCHWWGEAIFDFVRCCSEHAKKRCLETPNDTYWVCGYAIRQHEINTDVTDDPEDSAFRRAMNVAGGLLLVLDKDATPFDRIWCDYELFKTVVAEPPKLLDIVTMRGKPRLLSQSAFPGEFQAEKSSREQKFPLSLLTRGIQVKLQNGNSTMEEDKTNILRSMGKDLATGTFNKETLNINVEFANRSLRSYLALAVWPQAVRQNIVRNFSCESADGSVCTLSLPEVVAQDTARTHLELSLGSMEAVVDRELASIAQGLPPNLKFLELSFEGCTNITDGGLMTLALRLSPLPLQRLQLSLTGCSHVTDVGIQSLADHVPQSLQELKLDFALCTAISTAGVQHLARKLPPNLTQLQASFTGTQANKEFKTLRQFKRWARI